MLTIEQQRDYAISQVILYGQIAQVPIIDDTEELPTIIDATQRATFWTASTTYEFGNVILPTVRNGHTYKCIVAGTSGTTEPIWPKTDFRIVNDGTSDPVLRWQEAGQDYANVFDIRAAIHAVW